MEFLVPQEGPFPELGIWAEGPWLAKGNAGLCAPSVPAHRPPSPVSMWPWWSFPSLFLVFSGDSLTSVVQICSVLLFTIALSHQPPVSWSRLERGCEVRLWWWEGPGALGLFMWRQESLSADEKKAIWDVEKNKACSWFLSHALLLFTILTLIDGILVSY